MSLVKEYLVYVWEVYYFCLNFFCNVLEKYIFCLVMYIKFQGGYFVWVVFFFEVDCDKFYDVCLNKYSVDFNKGLGFFFKG